MWGHRVSFFVIRKNVCWFLLSGKMCEKFILLLCMKKSQDYKFKLFFFKKNLHLVRSKKKLLYWKEHDHISSLKKEDILYRFPVQMLIGSTYKMTEIIA